MISLIHACNFFNHNLFFYSNVFTLTIKRCHPLLICSLRQSYEIAANRFTVDSILYYSLQLHKMYENKFLISNLTTFKIVPQSNAKDNTHLNAAQLFADLLTPYK